MAVSKNRRKKTSKPKKIKKVSIMREGRNQVEATIVEVEQLALEIERAVNLYDGMAWGEYAVEETRNTNDTVITVARNLKNTIQQTAAQCRQDVLMAAEKYKNKELEKHDYAMALNSIGMAIIQELSNDPMTQVQAVLDAITAKEKSYEFEHDVIIDGD